MLGRLFRLTAAGQQSAMNRVGRRPLQYSRYWKNLTDTDFQDRSYCKTFIERNYFKHAQRTQRGLFHGREEKSGFTYCFSDKRTRRRFKVNAHYKTYHSEILGKDLEIKCSTKAMKTIRKYGGLDNYILLCKESKMQSTYGEYLREFMFRKLLDPSMPVNEVLREPRFRVHFKKKGKRLLKFKKKINNYVWIPPSIRHTDLSEHHELDEAHIPLREVRQVDEAHQVRRAQAQDPEQGRHQLR